MARRRGLQRGAVRSRSLHGRPERIRAAVAGRGPVSFDPYAVPSPCYVAEETKLRANCALLKRVAEESGAEIILALKGFAMWGVFPIVREYLPGVTASSVNEARLGAEEFGGEVHYYAPVILDHEIDEVVKLSHHLVFNSLSQLERHRAKALAAGVKIGVRVNPQCAVVKTDLYNPCVRFSRLGITAAELDETRLDGITGLHFHALCENSADELEEALAAVEAKFGPLIHTMEWVNFGGGHHITRDGYDTAKLVRLVKAFREKYGVKVILEPGEAIALNAGVLVASVVDLIHNEIDIAMLDTSAAAHMPDVLEMPYRPEIAGGERPGMKAHTYRLGGMTCLAGDYIGDYSFDAPLKIGDRLLFGDALHYSMVKNNTFNGVPLPSIGIWNADGAFTLLKSFGYEDYKGRLS
ncbi:MAG: carboxynorspermidine decarboxylase [Nitrospinae bacterium]|nr:carboxynorspermidine decarboxylase [Nitrospinota bacterium]